MVTQSFVRRWQQTYRRIFVCMVFGKNRHRFKSSGELKINDNGLTAITLLVAQSKPDEKEIIIQLIVALIADSK